MNENYIKVKVDILTSSLTDGAIRVLLYLMSCSKDGLCYPSVRTMADNLSKSKTSINNYLSELEEKGFIAIENRFVGTGKKTSNVYLINETLLIKRKKKEPIEEENRKPTEEQLRITEFDWINN